MLWRWRLLICNAQCDAKNTKQWCLLLTASYGLVQPFKFWSAVVCCSSHWAFNSGAIGWRRGPSHLIISAHNITIIHLCLHHDGLSYSFICDHSFSALSHISSHTCFLHLVFDLFSIFLFGALNLTLLCMQYCMSVLLTHNFTCFLMFIFSKNFRDRKNSGKM